MENKCRVFWGNVLNMAYIAEKTVASFPADTTPHYMISPKITCDKFDFKKIEKIAAEKSAGGSLKMTPDMKKEVNTQPCRHEEKTHRWPRRKDHLSIEN